METASVTFAIFAAFSGLRMFSYLPQIRKVARDPNGASAISYATWSLWTGANLATALYAFANLGDMYLAFVSTVYALCCATVIVLTMVKRHGLALGKEAWHRRHVRQRKLCKLIEMPARPS
jgi:amino acid permease